MLTCHEDPAARGMARVDRLGRRQFITATAGGALLMLAGFERSHAAAPVTAPTSESPPQVSIVDAKPGEDLVAYVTRKRGKFDHDFYKAVIGSANEYKEGDESLGISAADRRDTCKTRAR